MDDDFTKASTIERGNGKKNILLLLLGVFAFLIIGAAAVWYFMINQNKLNDEELSTANNDAITNYTDQVEQIRDVQKSALVDPGFITFADDDADGRSLIYSYDTERSTTTLAFPQGDQEYNLEPRTVMKDGVNIIYYLNTRFEPDSDLPLPFTERKSVALFDPRDNSKTQISNLSVGNRKQLNVSSDGQRFVTTGLRSDYPLDRSVTQASIEDYSIYMGSISEDESELTQGFSPQWSADNTKIFFARSNGVYVFDLETNNIETLAQNPKWVLDFWTPFIISPDETAFLGYDYENKRLTAYSIKDLELHYSKTYQLPGNEGDIRSFSYSSDEKSIVYSSRIGSTAKISLLDLQSSMKTDVLLVPILTKIDLYPNFGVLK